MCTVSFVATKDYFILTSNRDEQIFRAALFPQKYNVDNQNLYFPKDPKAGGTWYAVNENGSVLVLLNGAEEKHHHQPPYNRSRGLVVLEIISNLNPIVFWDNINLDNVEPFSLILFQNLKLYQLRWNGFQKSRLDLDIFKKHIWSSSTLYSKEIRDQREKWFLEFSASKAELLPEDLIQFHGNSHSQDSQNGLIINRDNVLKTLSITQTVIRKNEICMVYKDLVNDKTHQNLIPIIR